MNLLGRLRPGRAGQGWASAAGSRGPAAGGGRGGAERPDLDRRPRPARGAYRTHRPTGRHRLTVLPNEYGYTHRSRPTTRPTGSPGASSDARHGHDRDVRRWISGTVHGRPAAACRRSPSSPTGGRQGPRESCGQAAAQPPAHPSRPGAARAGGPRETPRFPDRVRRRDLFLAHRLTPRPAPPHRAAPPARPAPPRPAFGTPFGTERMSGGAAQRSTRLRPPGLTSGAQSQGGGQLVRL